MINLNRIILIWFRLSNHQWIIINPFIGQSIGKMRINSGVLQEVNQKILMNISRIRCLFLIRINKKTPKTFLKSFKDAQLFRRLLLKCLILQSCNLMLIINMDRSQFKLRSVTLQTNLIINPKCLKLIKIQQKNKNSKLLPIYVLADIFEST